MRIDTLAVTARVRVSGPRAVAHRVHHDLTRKTECVSVTRQAKQNKRQTSLWRSAA